jgi:hypothetical protein
MANSKDLRTFQLTFQQLYVELVRSNIPYLVN